MSLYQDFLKSFQKNDIVYINKVCEKLNTSRNNAKQIIYFFQKKDVLTKLYKGIYVFNFEQKKLSKEFFFELGCKISNGYVSGQYVLYENSLINAYYGDSYTFFCNKEIQSIDMFGKKLQFIKIPNKNYFFNPEGINFFKDYSIASPERAVLDIYQVYNLLMLDNIQLLDQNYFDFLIDQLMSVRKKKALMLDLKYKGMYDELVEYS